MEIEVITAEEIADVPITKEDRRIQIAEFVRNTGWDPSQEHNLLEMEEYSAQRELFLTKPDIKSLLLRKILSYDFVIPKIETDDIDSSQESIELDFVKPANHEKFGDYVIPAGQKFKLLSIEFKNVPPNNFLSEWFKQRQLFTLRYPWDPDYDSRLQQGALSYLYGAIMTPVLGSGIKNISTKDYNLLFDYLAFSFQYNRSKYPAELLCEKRSKIKPSISSRSPDSGIEIIPLTDPKHSKFFESIQDYLNVKVDQKWVSAIFEDLMSRKLFHLYEKYLLYGINSIKFDVLKDKKSINDAQERQQNETYQKQILEQYEEAGRAWMFRDKFNKSYDSANAAQKQLVSKNFDRLQSFWKSVRANKCPHVSLYRNYRKDSDERQKIKHYIQLRKFFNDELREGIITCNNCDFDIMCSHVRERQELKNEKVSNEEIIAKLNKYYDTVPIFGSIFCKYCGEKIAQSEESIGITIFEAGQFIKREQAMDEIRDMIWNEANQIIRSVIVFAIEQSNRYLNSLSATIADTIYDDVKKQQQILLRSKTATLEDVNTRLQLFTVIYIYAILVKVTKDNPKEVKFKGNVKSDLKTIFKDAFNLLITTKQSLISKIPNITNDFIKSYLVKAYSIVVEKYNTQTSVGEEQRGDQFTVLRLDPIFWHTLALKQVDALRKGKPVIDPRDVEKIIGKTLEELSKTKNAYENVSMNFNGWISQAKDPVKSLRGDELQKFMDDLREEIIVNSYNNQLNYVQSRVFLEYLFVSSDINPHIREYQDKSEAIAKREELLADLVRFRRVRSFHVHFNEKLTGFVYDPTQLNKIYGKDGHKHKWDSIQYSVQNPSYIIEIKCTICGESKSDPGKYDPSNVLMQIHQKANFFNQYEFQCPEDGKYPYHEWTSKNICRKCKVSPEEIYSKSTKYYNKYKDVFEKSMKAKMEIDEDAIRTRKVEPEPSINIIWRHNPALITQFINKLIKINKMSHSKAYNIYYNLGLSEGYQYEDIIKGKVSPTRDIGECEYLSRYIRLDTYIRKLIHEYYFVKYQSRVSRMPQHIAILIKDLEKRKKKINYMQLPRILPDYTQKLNQLRRDMIGKDNANETISNFTLDTLLNTLLDILKTDIGDIFVKWFTDNLVINEEHYALLSEKEEAQLTQQKKYDFYDTPQAEVEFEEEYDDFDYDGSNDEDNLVD